MNRVCRTVEEFKAWMRPELEESIEPTPEEIAQHKQWLETRERKKLAQRAEFFTKVPTQKQKMLFKTDFLCEEALRVEIVESWKYEGLCVLIGDKAIIPLADWIKQFPHGVWGIEGKDSRDYDVFRNNCSY